MDILFKNAKRFMSCLHVLIHY